MRPVDHEEVRAMEERHRRRFVIDGEDDGRFTLRDVALTAFRFQNSLLGARFVRCRLDAVEFDGASLEDATLDRCTLTRCNVSHLPATRLYAERAVFTGCDLRGSSLHRAHLKDASLDACELDGATLTRIFANGARFSGSRLTRVDFELAWLDGTDFRGAALEGARLRRCHLSEATLSGLDLRGVDFTGSDLARADFSGSDLSGAVLQRADLRDARLTGARLVGADLSHALLAGADLSGADLTGARVYGASVWDLVTDTQTLQRDLVITPPETALMTVDDVEVAQFVYLLLDRAKLRQVIDTITSRAVLILGRFTPERKAVLDVVAGELRTHGLLPILFDFERSRSRDFTETIKTLAGLSLFVVADLTNPKSAPLELQATVPDYQIPFVPIIQEGEAPFSMFADLGSKYDWVLDPLAYPSTEALRRVFKPAVIERAWTKHQELVAQKGRRVEVLSVDQFLQQR